MNAEQLTDKICEYARKHLASKAQNNLTRFLIGAGTAGAGRTLLKKKVVEMAAVATAENGEINVRALKDSVMGGFELAASVPVLGGLLSLDASDANEFFSFIGV